MINAIAKTKNALDSSVIDCKDKDLDPTSADFIDNIGTLPRDGLIIACIAFVAAKIVDQIKFGRSGKMSSVFDIVRGITFGIDWRNKVSEFMFAIGRIQPQICQTGKISNWHSDQRFIAPAYFQCCGQS